MPTHSQKANALTPGDWSSLRDVIRDLAADVDKLNAASRNGAAKKDAAPASQPGGAASRQ